MKTRIQKIVVVCLVAVIGWICWIGYTIWSFGNRDTATLSDCAIVLGAAVYGSKPSPVFEERIRHAIGLYQQGVVSKIIFTGGYGAGVSHAESEVGARYAIQAGVPKRDLLTETRSRTTQENLAEAKAVMAVQALTSAVIVSDPLHSRRAAMMAKDLGISAVTSPTATTRYRSLKTRLQFLAREIYFFHHYLFTGE